MFTGIIEEVGTVQQLCMDASVCRLTIAAKKVLEDVHLGDSIATSGVCLTVCEVGGGSFSADVMPETMRRTSLCRAIRGSKVNLERAMPLGGRFGGHIVLGHVDATGTVTNFRREKNAVWVTVAAGGEILRYVVEKGSVALDGISLTVAKVTARDFSVSIIPHTAAETTLLQKKPGDMLNIECDILAKYVEKLLHREGKITPEFLAAKGFI